MASDPDFVEFVVDQIKKAGAITQTKGKKNQNAILDLTMTSHFRIGFHGDKPWQLLTEAGDAK